MKLSKRLHLQRNPRDDMCYATFRIFDIKGKEELEELIGGLRGLVPDEDYGRAEINATDEGRTYSFRLSAKTLHDIPDISEAYIKGTKSSLRFTVKGLGDVGDAASFVDKLPGMLVKATGYDTLDQYVSEKSSKSDE